MVYNSRSWENEVVSVERSSREYTPIYTDFCNSAKT